MDGQWFPRQVIQFRGGPNVIPSSGSGYSFTMVAGDYVGFVSGYMTAEASGTTQIGSLDVEPIAGYPLHQFISLNDGSVGSIAFSGNAVAEVAGKTVWVNGVEYPFDDLDWTYDSDGDITGASWSTGTPLFVPSSVYPSEIK